MHFGGRKFKLSGHADSYLVVYSLWTTATSTENQTMRWNPN